MKWKKTIWGNNPWVYTYFHDSSRGGADERKLIGEMDEWKFGLGVRERGAILLRHVGQGGLCYGAVLVKGNGW